MWRFYEIFPFFFYIYCLNSSQYCSYSYIGVELPRPTARIKSAIVYNIYFQFYGEKSIFKIQKMLREEELELSPEDQMLKDM